MAAAPPRPSRTTEAAYGLLVWSAFTANIAYLVPVADRPAMVTGVGWLAAGALAAKCLLLCALLVGYRVTLQRSRRAGTPPRRWLDRLVRLLRIGLLGAAHAVFVYAAGESLFSTGDVYPGSVFGVNLFAEHGLATQLWRQVVRAPRWTPWPSRPLGAGVPEWS